MLGYMGISQVPGYVDLEPGFTRAGLVLCL